MASEKTRSVTVRIPNDVLDFLDAEAEGRGESRSKVFSDRLRVSISRAADRSKSAEKRSQTASNDTDLGDVFE